MATTTNYGWDTPDDTDLVKDGAAAIRTLGSSIDTTTKALNPSTTLGDIEYRSATANTNTRLALGTAGQVLTVNSGATAPEWATAAAAGGKVLQVVSTTYSTSLTISTTTYTDTNLTLSITPTLATSKVLVMFGIQCTTFRNSAANSGGLRLMRGATAIWNDTATSTSIGTFNNGITSSELKIYQTASYLDSPATTSSTTYKVQAKTWETANGGNIKLHTDSNEATMILMEIGA